MDSQRRVRVSKFLSLHLRHTPGAIGLALEPGGWVAVDAVLAGAAGAGFAVSREELDEVVRTCDKQRFALDETGTKVRANQGHSADVDLQLEPADPPAELYHGTPGQSVAAILRDGLRKMARHHVHLSPDTATAARVGGGAGGRWSWRSAGRMRADGHVFYRSANGVWLVDHVPPAYLRLV